MRVELGSEGEGAKSVRRGKELYKYFAQGEMETWAHGLSPCRLPRHNQHWDTICVWAN